MHNKKYDLFNPKPRIWPFIYSELDKIAITLHSYLNKSWKLFKKVLVLITQRN